GTLQDRLVSELRVRGVATRAAANAFLPEFIVDFNQRFARPPRQAEAVWRRPPRDLDLLLGCRYQRVVGRDNTVRLGHRLLQLPAGRPAQSYARRRVEVRELVDGRVVVLLEDRVLVTAPSPGADSSLAPRAAPSAQRPRAMRAPSTPPLRT